MPEALRVANTLYWRLNLFSYTLSLNGVWFFLIFLVLPFLFFLTVVLLFLDLCPIVHPQCTRLGNLFIINNILTLFIKKKKNIYIYIYILLVFINLFVRGHVNNLLDMVTNEIKPLKCLEFIKI